MGQFDDISFYTTISVKWFSWRVTVTIYH